MKQKYDDQAWWRSMIDIFIIQQKNDLKVVIFLKFNNIFLNNLALKTLRRRESTGPYETTKTT